MSTKAEFRQRIHEWAESVHAVQVTGGALELMDDLYDAIPDDDVATVAEHFEASAPATIRLSREPWRSWRWIHHRLVAEVFRHGPLSIHENYDDVVEDLADLVLAWTTSTTRRRLEMPTIRLAREPWRSWRWLHHRLVAEVFRHGPLSTHENYDDVTEDLADLVLAWAAKARDDAEREPF